MTETIATQSSREDILSPLTPPILALTNTSLKIALITHVFVATQQ